MKMEEAISPAMHERVLAALEAIEARHHVRVLYACESGSRGWGFSSPDSDYDVRFIYVHQPEWYLRIEPPRDVIELPIDSELDVCGWELRKTLGLLKAANPTLMEWLDSPVIYRQHPETVQALRGWCRISSAICGRAITIWPWRRRTFSAICRANRCG